MEKKLGRKPLSKTSKTKFTAVRLTEEVRARIEALVGANRMALFIREAIDAELNRREEGKNAENSGA
ncbi:hypothetical protein [Rhizobium leguminosarum]|uniref:hypothetical protein n=1 Tax=Rhizobium leguminosarum TaxID=384 RepID=UPI00144143C2|nr:hypothetical protein [Rhizobium leguminosarum]MBY5869336.1 hypothetical protein [Rhizobium leguminosarum]NKM08401.1 hypothetical protein [Rhizobium leguminosarum bv. viciae]